MLALRHPVSSAERPVKHLHRVVSRTLQRLGAEARRAPGSGAPAPSARAPDCSAAGPSAPATPAGSAASPERSNRSTPSSSSRYRALVELGVQRSPADRRRPRSQPRQPRARSLRRGQQPVERCAPLAGELRGELLEGSLMRPLACPRHQPHHPVDRRALDPPAPQLAARLGEQQRGPLVLERTLDQPRSQRLELGPPRGNEPRVRAHRETMLPTRRHTHRVFEDRARRHVQRAGEPQRSPPAARRSDRRAQTPANAARTAAARSRADPPPRSAGARTGNPRRRDRSNGRDPGGRLPPGISPAARSRRRRETGSAPRYLSSRSEGSRPPAAGRCQRGGCTGAWSPGAGARPTRLTNTRSTLPDQPRQERVTQDVSRQLHARILPKASDDIIDRPLRQPPPGPPDEHRPLAPGRQTLALGQPLLQDLPHQGVERHLPVSITLPAPNDHQALARRHLDVVDVERYQLREPQPRVQQHHHDRPIPRRAPLRHPQQPPLLLLRQSARRLRRQILTAHHRPPKAELGVERIQRRQRQVHRRRLPPLDRLQMPLVVPHRQSRASPSASGSPSTGERSPSQAM